MSFYAALVRRPVTVIMLAIAAAVFGMVSYRRLPLTLMPDLSYPTITVRTELPGAAPEEVEAQVARPVEEALATTEGLVRIESRSRAGVADVVLQLGWGVSLDRASQDIRERLQTTFLPDDAERPLILRYDPSLDPILRIALSWDPESPDAPRGDEAELELRRVAETELKRRLEAMDGVAAVRVRGGLTRQVRVEAREDWLAARGVTLDQLVSVLGAENVNLPGGSIFQGQQEYLVRTLGEVRSLDEIADLAIVRADGVRVPVREVARVVDGHEDREVQSALDGQIAVELEVMKTADANIVRVARALKERLEAPPGVKLTVLDDQSAFIESALDNLGGALWQGALLSVAVIWLFLRNWRATLIISASIPLSLVLTFAPLYMGGVSLNLMSLGGLALGVGMIVDNSIVVLESIQVYVDRGMSRLEAAERGTREVAAAVAASTLTTVGVFLPIAFVEGVAGQVFGDLSLAVVFSISASLVVALLFVPVLAARDPKVEEARGRIQDISTGGKFASVVELRATWAQGEGWRRRINRLYALMRFVLAFTADLWGLLLSALSAVVVLGLLGLLRLIWRPVGRVADLAALHFNTWYARRAEGYSRLLSAALRRPGRLLSGVTLAVALSVLLGLGLGQALIPELHQSRFTVDLSLPVGTPLGRTITMSDEAVSRLREIEGVRSVHATVGTERRVDSRPDAGEHTARLSVQLEAGGDPEALERRVTEQARAALAPLAEEGMEARISRPNLFSFQTPLELVIYAQDLDTLREASARAVAALSPLPGLRDLRSSLVPGYPEVRVRYDRDLLQRFGLTTGDAAERVRARLQGQRASRVSRGEGRVDLVVRLSEDDRRALGDLGRININPAVNPVIPLSAVASFEEGVGPSEVRRIDQRRAVVVSAETAGLALSAQAEAARRALSEVDLGADWEIAGQDLEMRRSLQSLGFALLLATFLVYVVMAATFESVIQPLVLLLTLPLAVLGVTPLLWVTGTPVSVVVLIGAIVLAGVVVNNGIVLVDCVNRLREEGLPRIEAIVVAASLRLRPILITALTTIIGVVPLALGLGDGSEIQQPLALTIMGGLTSSTFLTLFVIPVVYERVTARQERARQGATP